MSLKDKRGAVLWLTRRYRIHSQSVEIDWLRDVLAQGFTADNYNIIVLGDGNRDVIIELYSGDRKMVQRLCQVITERSKGCRVLFSESSALFRPIPAA